MRGPIDIDAGAARSHLHRVLLDGTFAVTAELATTDGVDAEEVARAVAPLVGKVDAVNCTDNSAANPHLSQVAAARLALDHGVEPVAQFGCRDRNRLALQADLLGAGALGVPNVVCMTGDDVTAGDHPEAKPLYDIDSMHLLRTARILRDQGTYLSGRPLSSAPTFLIGAVENPFAPPFDYRPVRLQKKLEAGAEFIQTQCVFNVPRMRTFMERAVELGCADHAWIMAGVYVPRSAGTLRFLREQVPGIDVPEELVRRMEGVPKERQREEGVRLAVEICEAMRELPGVAGLHLMSIRGDDAIVETIERLGLAERPVRAGEPSTPV